MSDANINPASEVSAAFQRFAMNTTKGDFDKARKSERIGRGIPFDIGMEGTAVISKIVCTDREISGTKVPSVSVELTIQSPEAAKGKVLKNCNGLGQLIMDSKKPGSDWKAADAWGAMLGMLENFGCPEEITRGYKQWSEVTDWFQEEPRYVHYTIVDASYEKNKKVVPQKGVEAHAVIDEDSLPTASSQEGPAPEDDPNATYVSFRSVKHKVLEEVDGVYKLESVKTGRVREGINETDLDNQA